MDGGQSWTHTSVPYNYSLFCIKFKNQQEGWLLGGLDCSNGSCTPKPVLMRSTDGGATWTDETHPHAGGAVAYYDIDFTGNGSSFSSGRLGTVISLDQSTVGVEELHTTSTVLYPNPCPEGQAVQIKSNADIFGYAIYDYSGRRVQSLDHTDFNVHNLHTEQLRSGAYLLELFGKDGQVTNRQQLLIN